MQCNLCGNHEFGLLYQGTLSNEHTERFAQYALYGDLYRCADCGLVHQRLNHNVGEIVALLEKEKYLDEPIGQLNYKEKAVQFSRLTSHIRRFTDMRGAALLDVGANTGVFLRECQAFGAQLAGIEPSQEAAEACQQQGLDVKNCVVENADFGTRTFDIVTMWDFVEHLYDPKADLAKTFALLRPGGFLFISTHDVDGLFAKLSGSQYPMFMYQHFFHFSPKTLSRMLREIGFEVINIQPFCKSWSVGYLHELLLKLWPQNRLARLLWLLSKPITKIPGVVSLQVTLPVRNFFILTARRPQGSPSGASA